MVNIIPEPPFQIFKNYMLNEMVFLLDEITTTNCSTLIGDLTSFVLNDQNRGKRLTFIINSPGGNVDIMITIIGLINIAKINDIEIYTIVLGKAGSAASIIATQGNFRLMNKISKHFIHFGYIFDITSKHSEIDKVYEQNKEYAETMIDLYLDASKGKLSRDRLVKWQEDERGYICAEECLKYGLCDEIIEDDLKEKQEQEKQFDDFKNTYDDWLKNKKKIDKKDKKVKKSKN